LSLLESDTRDVRSNGILKLIGDEGQLEAHKLMVETIPNARITMITHALPFRDFAAADCTRKADGKLPRLVAAVGQLAG
jgi:hypothetical protein